MLLQKTIIESGTPSQAIPLAGERRSRNQDEPQVTRFTASLGILGLVDSGAIFQLELLPEIRGITPGKSRTHLTTLPALNPNIGDLIRLVPLLAFNIDLRFPLKRIKTDSNPILQLGLVMGDELEIPGSEIRGPEHKIEESQSLQRGEILLTELFF
jgi:hypothetical protein